MLSFTKIINISTLLLMISGCSFFEYRPKYQSTNNREIVMKDTTYHVINEDRYCIIGEERELWNRNIIHRVRGFTRQYIINPHILLNESHIIDPHSIDSVLVTGYSVKVLGLIPYTSYKIEELDNGSFLVVIINKTLFWKNNKVAVITYREY